MIENQACSFLLSWNATASGTRSLLNVIEGFPVKLKVPINKNVLIKNIRCNTWGTNMTQTAASTLITASGSFYFTSRFSVLSNGDFYRQGKGIVEYPNGIPATIFGSTLQNVVGEETVEYILNSQQTEAKDLNLVGDGIQLNQLGYALNSYSALDFMFMNITIEYQNLNC